jgi:glutathione S-transferase
VVVPPQALDLIRGLRIPFSTNVERVALAAGYKGVEIEWIDIGPDDRSRVVEASGQRLVPVLLVGDEAISDSPQILDWLEEHFPQPSLLPADPARRAEVRVFVDWFNQVWKRFPNAINDGAGDAAEPAAEMRRAVETFEALLAGRNFLFGDFGLADVTAFPFLKYASLGLQSGDVDSFHAVLAEQMRLRPDSPLHAWVARIDAYPRG